MVLTYMTLLVLFVLPIGLSWYLEGIPTVSKERLAVLTITSPFSAAMSVPMHTTRNAGVDQSAASRRGVGPDPDRADRQAARSGRSFSAHLPAVQPALLRAELHRVPLEMVALGRPGIVRLRRQGINGRVSGAVAVSIWRAEGTSGLRPITKLQIVSRTRELNESSSAISPLMIARP